MVTFFRHLANVMGKSSFYSDFFKYYCLHFLILGRLFVTIMTTQGEHIYLFSQILIKETSNESNLAEVVTLEAENYEGQSRFPSNQDFPAPKSHLVPVS